MNINESYVLYVHTILRKKQKLAVSAFVLKNKEFKPVFVGGTIFDDCENESQARENGLQYALSHLNEIITEQTNVEIRIDKVSFTDLVDYNGPEQVFFKNEFDFKPQFKDINKNTSIRLLTMAGIDEEGIISAKACCLKQLKDESIPYPESWGEPANCLELYIMNQMS